MKNHKKYLGTTVQRNWHQYAYFHREVNASTVVYFGKSFESMHILKVIRLLNSGVLDYQIFITFFLQKNTCQYNAKWKPRVYGISFFLKGGFLVSFFPKGHTNLFKP